MGLVKSSKEPAWDGVDRRAKRRDCPGLLKQLQAESASERCWAARDLAVCPKTSAALCERLAVETCPHARQVFLTSLVQHNNEAAVSGLLQLLRSADAALRNGVVQALQQMPELVAPRMEALLADADADVRIFAIKVLESLPHSHTPHWLRGVIERDEHVNVCATAVDLLVEIGDRSVITALKQLPARFPQQPFIEFAVQFAVHRIEATG